jgi:FtsZ-binding cell division protein ZapB
MKRFAHAAVIALSLISPARAAEPDWPCMQRKMSQLGLKQVWTGPDLALAAAKWADDGEISALVQDLASRRLPIDDARQRLKAYAAGLPKEQAKPKLEMVVQGLFDRLNREREQVISGITRYAKRQADMAARLRREISELDHERSNSTADAIELDRKTQALDFETRMFQERVQALRYVCEVPAQFEQRLFALLQQLAALMHNP